VVFYSEIRGFCVSEKSNYKSFKETTLVGYSFEVLYQGEANGLKMHRKAVFKPRHGWWFPLFSTLPESG
jgi:hypothetical protein